MDILIILLTPECLLISTLKVCGLLPCCAQDPRGLPLAERRAQGARRARRDQAQGRQAAEGHQLAAEHRRQDTGAQHAGNHSPPLIPTKLPSLSSLSYNM